MKKRPQNRKTPQRHGRDKLPAAPIRNDQAPTLSAGRKWAFRLIALVCIPLLALGGLEAALRLAGYGYRTNFFDTISIGHQKFLADNENFSLRFFPPQLTRWPNPVLMEARKPTNTFRIFILGESAAQGDPEPAYGAWHYLEVLLRERYPDEHFEIINVAITAINSNVILPIARACAHRDGDLWIIYMGNNEMVGPFGAATVFGAKAPPWWLIRLNLAVQQTRVGQLITSLTRKLRNKSTEASWGGMQMFLGNQLAPDDPRRETVYRNFQRNLQDILRAGLHSGVKIILNTVAVNLKDCPPFASATNSRLASAGQTQFDAQLAGARQKQAEGQFAAAAQLYGEAAQWDATFAELQFRWGECLLAQNQLASARDHFQLACDDDALPFRADSRINELIRQAGEKFTGPDLDLFDAVRALETNGPARIPGQETFYEHVHFNFDGSYRLARAWADQVQHFLPESVQSQATNGWDSQETCERLLALTDWNRSLVLQVAVLPRMQEPPLSTQFNNDRRVQAINNQLQELHQRMAETNAQANARAIYQDAIKHAPGDYMLHENYAEFLQYIGDSKQSASEWLTAGELSPRNPFTFCQAGRVLAQMGQATEAQAAFSKAISLHPRYFEAWLELGKLRFAEGKYEPARQYYEQARLLQPNDPHVYYEMGRTLSLLQRPAESIESFRRAIQLKPDYWEAHYCLGGELAMQDEIAEAKSEFETVIQLQPGYALAHLNLGVAFMKQNQLNDASREFQETLQLDPGNRLAAQYLNQAQYQKTTLP
ncbi:MAG TPA: tetratricopeptide repeat protein [Candidatus Acidoferrales bacterium]|nr:tetratricopeptide repeat protein [Candidatus Acidoferrales bacterium]